MPLLNGEEMERRLRELLVKTSNDTGSKSSDETSDSKKES